MRRVSRGAIFWGSALVTAGVVILAIQQGLIDDALLASIGQWWPLLLIGAGVAIIFAGTLGAVAVALSGILLGLLVGGLVSGAADLSVGCGTEDPGELMFVQGGSFEANGAEVEVDLDCATVEIVGADGNAWSVEADDQTAGRLEFTDGADGADTLAVRTVDDVISAGIGERGHVVVTVPGTSGTHVSMGMNAGEANLNLADGTWGQLDFEGNAMSMTVDLSGAEADGLAVSLNAGSATVLLGEGTDIGSAVQFGANAGSIEVCAPEGIGLQITMGDDVTVGHNLDEMGLEEDGDVWRTEGYDSADTRIQIEFEGNAASFTLSPEGEC